MYRHMFPQTLEEQFSGEAYQVATFCLAHHLVPQPMDETPPAHVAWELRVGIRIVQGWKEGINRFKIFIPEGFRWGRPVAESDSLDGIMAAL